MATVSHNPDDRARVIIHLNDDSAASVNALAPADQAYSAAVEAVLKTVAESSRRIYAQVFVEWQAYAEANDFYPADILIGDVEKFLIGQPVTRSTRQRKLSALRALAGILALDRRHPERHGFAQMLARMRVPAEGEVESDRELKALAPEEVAQVRTAWSGESLIEKRNRAIIAVLFDAGVRRAEAAALQWGDVNFRRGTLTVRRGKGKKRREVALFGADVINALEVLRNAQGGGFTWVFGHVDKHGHIHDRPITGQLVYLVVKQTEERTGITFKPHDARRSLITGLLDRNAPLHEVQAQAGHAQGNTTMRYAQAGAAEKRRGKYNPYEICD